jgi:hypothetical protein
MPVLDYRQVSSGTGGQFLPEPQADHSSVQVCKTSPVQNGVGCSPSSQDPYSHSPREYSIP